MIEIKSANEGYEDRYCAFVDILGFRQLISEIAEGRIPPAHLRIVLNHVHNPPDIQPSHWRSLPDFRSQSISDAVALSTAVRPEGIESLFLNISNLAVRLLPYGYFIRGSIVKGKLYHRDNTVFGEALVRAYDFESKIANFPRVIISRDVELDVELAERAGYHGGMQSLRKFVLQADDGPFYLNVLQPSYEQLISECVDNQSKPAAEIQPCPTQSLLSVIQDELQDRFDASVDDPNIFKKLQWFASYWNRFTFPGVAKIRGPGL